jgi:CubicO group peptidase (beta-lactamase class C family)
MTSAGLGVSVGDMSLMPLPAQAADVPWPTEAWPAADLPSHVDRARFGALMAKAFGQAESPTLGRTDAFVLIQGGKLLAERYGEGLGPDHTNHSWSEAKSITHALVGLLVGDGKLDIHAPADVPEWREPGDPRGAITLDHLLRMSSGLAFSEVYEPDRASDTIEMLWGSGKSDVAHFAASFPLDHPPGGFWAYSSGTTNIVSRCVARAIDASGPGYEAFMRERLFGPLGMRSPIPKFDAAGTFIGSSFCFATARDFARFGLLYLRDGVWEGRRLLPPGWVDYARTPTFQQSQEFGPYGAHWWLDMVGPGSFSANGHEAQYTVLVPDLDLIVVRNGQTPMPHEVEVKAWIGEIVQCFRG